jgi:hypothetical protein
VGSVGRFFRQGASLEPSTNPCFVGSPSNNEASKLKAAAGSSERLMLPRLNSIDGELKAINTRIDATNSTIDGVEKSVSPSKSELRTEIRAMDTKVSAMDKRLTFKLDKTDRNLDIDRMMTILEAKLKEL